MEFNVLSAGAWTNTSVNGKRTTTVPSQILT